MNNDEFKALKTRLIARASRFVDLFGYTVHGTNGPITSHRHGVCAVVRSKDQLFVMTPFKNYLTGETRFAKIYDEVDGVERPLGLTHSELVKQYMIALAEIDRALLLEDLSRV